MVKKRKLNRYAGLGQAGMRGVRAVLSRYSAPNIASRRVGKRSVDMLPLTTERDVRMTYRKRRMNRRRKKRYVKSLKRWRSLQMRSEGSHIFKFIDTRNNASQLNTSQYFGAFVGLCGQNNYDNSLSEVWNKITDGASAGTRTNASGLRIDHMSLTVVLRNVSSNIVAGSSNAVDIDIYKVICIKDIPLGASPAWAQGTGIESWLSVQKNKMRQVKGMDEPLSDGGVGISTSVQNAGGSSSNQVVGDMLFDNPPACAYWKVLKVWKIHLPAGSTCNFGLRNSRNKYVSKQECFEPGVAAKRYLTEGYIFNINGRWNPETGSFEAVQVAQETYVRYNCKRVNATADTLTFDGN